MFLAQGSSKIRKCEINRDEKKVSNEIKPKTFRFLRDFIKLAIQK